MAKILDPYSLISDISITLTIYDRWEQTTRRSFSLRNVNGETEEEHVAHARQIMDEVAVELHHITNLGVDKGVLKFGKKKIEEKLYPDLTPHETVKYFAYGINVRFIPVSTYQWHKDSRKAARANADMIKDGWEALALESNKWASFRLPVQPAFNKQKGLFFSFAGYKKRKRKTVSWNMYYDRDDPLFQRFIARFYDSGNLSFGEERYWCGTSPYVEIRDTFWAPPKFDSPKAPRKTKIASQPTDNTDYVYLIRMGPTKFYKIGKTNDPQGRLAALQTASPYKLKLLHTFQADNASAAEESLHARFYGSRLEGEWFKLSDGERNALLSVEKYQNQRFLVKGEVLDLNSLFDIQA